MSPILLLPAHVLMTVAEVLESKLNTASIVQAFGQIGLLNVSWPKSPMNKPKEKEQGKRLPLLIRANYKAYDNKHGYGKR